MALSEFTTNTNIKSYTQPGMLSNAANNIDTATVECFTAQKKLNKLLKDTHRALEAALEAAVDDPSSIEEAAKAIGKLEEIDETLNEAQYDLINSIGFITWVRDAARSLIAELAAE
jgi:hypothetical protein